ncbi:uncharacterized protein LOC116662698 [Camelus ferus]|uniref:Uncharacterized protein LOC116662698 n=1 Tax=Camelus ferus TaxID=419612 RepID=A0A8B8SST0_CAMFR|nr:uncharacterized protein LOC116662698 [Camelus ferus]
MLNPYWDCEDTVSVLGDQRRRDSTVWMRRMVGKGMNHSPVFRAHWECRFTCNTDLMQDDYCMIRAFQKIRGWDITSGRSNDFADGSSSKLKITDKEIKVPCLCQDHKDTNQLPWCYRKGISLPVPREPIESTSARAATRTRRLGASTHIGLLGPENTAAALSAPVHQFISGEDSGRNLSSPVNLDLPVRRAEIGRRREGSGWRSRPSQ